MKKFIIKLFFLIISISIFSCEDQLNIDPRQDIDSNDVLNNESGIKQILIGAYATAARGGLYGGRILTSADLLGATANENTSHVFWEGTFAACNDIFNKTMVSDNTFAEDIYRRSYDIINATNIVIEKANVIGDPVQRKTAVAEARFLQGLVYFDLVRFFALPYDNTTSNNQLGVIIRDKAIYDYLNADLSAQRSKVNEVYSLVINNLQSAYSDLPANNSFYADKFAARALLARVYLQQQNYIQSAICANDVIVNGGYSLSANFGAAFNHASKEREDIFSIQITTQTGDNQINNLYASTVNGGRGGDITISDNYINKFTDINDSRRNFNYIDPASNRRLTSKFTDQYADVVLIRLAEMFLIRAESNFRQGTNLGDTPLNDVNKLKIRANASTLTSITLNDILLERELELGFEGFLIHDIKRTKSSIIGQSETFLYNDKYLVFPIPLRELNSNRLISQNPGY